MAESRICARGSCLGPPPCQVYPQRHLKNSCTLVGSFSNTVHDWVDSAVVAIKGAVHKDAWCMPLSELYYDLQSRRTRHVAIPQGTVAFVIGLSGGGKTRWFLEEMFEADGRSKAAYMTLSSSGNGGSKIGTVFMAYCCFADDAEAQWAWGCAIILHLLMQQHHGYMGAHVDPSQFFVNGDPLVPLAEKCPKLEDKSANVDLLLQAAASRAGLESTRSIFVDEVQKTWTLQNIVIKPLLRAIRSLSTECGLGGTGVHWDSARQVIEEGSGSFKNKLWEVPIAELMDSAERYITQRCSQGVWHEIQVQGGAKYFVPCRPRIAARFVDDYNSRPFGSIQDRVAFSLESLDRRLCPGVTGSLLDKNALNLTVGNSAGTRDILSGLAELALFSRMVIKGRFLDEKRVTLMNLGVAPVHKNLLTIREHCAIMALLRMPEVTSKLCNVIPEFLTSNPEPSAEGFAFEMVAPFGICSHLWKTPLDQVQFVSSLEEFFATLEGKLEAGVFVFFPDKMAGPDILIARISKEVAVVVVQSKRVRCALSGAELKHALATTDLTHLYCRHDGSVVKCYTDIRERAVQFAKCHADVITRVLLSTVAMDVKGSSVVCWNPVSTANLFKVFDTPATKQRVWSLFHKAGSKGKKAKK